MSAGLKKHILQSLIRLIVLLLLTSFVVFAFVSANATDTTAANYGVSAKVALGEEKLAQISSYWSSDTPLLNRYFSWISGILSGDFGWSLKYNDSVSNIVSLKLSQSFLMLLISWLISGFLGYFLGVWAGFKQNSVADKVISAFCYVISSTPTYWIAMIFLFVFSVELKWFPIGFSNSVMSGSTSIADSIHHAILPALTLSLVGISNVAMHTREKTIDVKRSDYVKFAELQGKSEFYVVKNHILKNVSAPFVSIQFAQISEIIAGSIMVETVFSYPGLGLAIKDAAVGGDVALLSAIALLCSAIVFVGNFAGDIITRLVSPEIGSDK